MADTQVLGTCVFGRAGSSPASRTSFIQRSTENCAESFIEPCIQSCIDRTDRLFTTLGCVSHD